MTKTFIIIDIHVVFIMINASNLYLLELYDWTCFVLLFKGRFGLFLAVFWRWVGLFLSRESWWGFLFSVNLGTVLSGSEDGDKSFTDL